MCNSSGNWGGGCGGQRGLGPAILHEDGNIEMNMTRGYVTNSLKYA